jgi:hypothetical protein
MAKKTRRVRRKDTQTRLSETQLAQPSQLAKSSPRAAEADAVEASAQSADVDLDREYAYVVSDLKRLGILAAAILGGMLILFFALSL